MQGEVRSEADFSCSVFLLHFLTFSGLAPSHIFLGYDRLSIPLLEDTALP